MQYAGHRRAVEKALDEGRSGGGGGGGGGGEVGVPAGWSAAAAIEKLEGAIRKGEGKRGSALLPHETLAAARAEVAELKALQAKERAAAEKAAEKFAARNATLEGHTSAVYSVCSLGDGRLASGGD